MHCFGKFVIWIESQFSAHNLGVLGIPILTTCKQIIILILTLLQLSVFTVIPNKFVPIKHRSRSQSRKQFSIQLLCPQQGDSFARFTRDPLSVSVHLGVVALRLIPDVARHPALGIGGRVLAAHAVQWPHSVLRISSRASNEVS